MRNCLTACVLVLVIVLCPPSSARGQGLRSSPYAAPSLLRGDSLDPVSSNLFGRTDSLAGIVPRSEPLFESPVPHHNIPNLQAGYLYYSGKDGQFGHITLDYILPVQVWNDQHCFSEQRIRNFRIFSKDTSARADDKVYLSMGGGYRTVLGGKAVVGFNGFYDLTQFTDQWVSSGGAGLEMALLVHGFDALDMNLNWYGDVSDSDVVVNEYRNGPANYDLQVWVLASIV